MKYRLSGSIATVFFIALIIILACNIGNARPTTQPPISPLPSATLLVPTETVPASTDIPIETVAVPTSAVAHTTTPADLAALGKLVYDVGSVDTAPEKRAPYGDSYDINRLERPFLQDMTYVAALDISTFNVGKDNSWWYVTISLVGSDPNDKLGIDYAVELDTNADGFGDYIVWAHPPYPAVWDTAPVQIFHDTNHDTGGRSAEKSDAPMPETDGYDTLVFNGGPGDADPDLAWVRTHAGSSQSSLQFAFKRSWSGDIFMLGVLADGGLKDPKKLDYVDRFTLAEAGSSIRANGQYPLKALYAFDNVCRDAFGFKPTGFEPQLCPRSEAPATKKPKPTSTPVGVIP